MKDKLLVRELLADPAVRDKVGVLDSDDEKELERLGDEVAEDVIDADGELENT